MKKRNIRFKNPEIFPSPSPSARYQLKYILALVSVPLLCGLILLLLFSVFADLNLYFLEANGMPIDEQIRDGYFQQVIIEICNMLGYLALQLLATFVAAIVAMRWASSPFRSAVAHLRSPDAKAGISFLSESPGFDQSIRQFSKSIREGVRGPTVKPQGFGTNYPFLIKFVTMFSVLSVSTGYVMSIIVDSVYRRIVDLAFQAVKPNQFMGHYFVAQQEILQKANHFTVGLSLLLFFIIGLQISRYMGTMIYVFSRAIHEDKFPIALRASDIYGDLAAALNEGRRKIK